MKDFWDRIAHDLWALIKNPASCLACAYAVYATFRIHQGHTDEIELLRHANVLLACTAFAILSDLHKRSQILDELRKIGKGDSPIEIHKNWHAKGIRDRTARMKKSLTIVDSFFDEAPSLSTDIREATDAGARDLTLRFYMLSPDGPYGGQRLREMDPENEHKSAAELEALYRVQFDGCVSAIIQRLQSLPNTTIQIFEYLAMPSVRLMIVDDIDYFFGYFPLHAANPLHSCQSAHANNEASRAAVEDLRRQFSEIQKQSKLVYPNRADRLSCMN